MAISIKAGAKTVSWGSMKTQYMERRLSFKYKSIHEIGPNVKTDNVTGSDHVRIGNNSFRLELLEKKEGYWAQ